MPDISEYIKRLNDLKMQSLDKYNESMKYYETNYPEFHKQLVVAMQESTKRPSGAKFKDFARDYKWYLIAIGAGVGVIIYLLYLLMTR
jgi:hypothetical protein